MNSVSIVVPTYNRGEQLILVVDHILKSDVSGIEMVEIIVVDDSSKIPAQKFLESKRINAPFSLKVLRQENSGPAAARNNGLRKATGDIVIFIDDDVIINSSLVKKHLAAHQLYSNSIIIGSYPLLPKEKETPLLRFLNKQIDHPEMSTGNDHYLLTTEVASGNLSIERKQFLQESFYNSDLRTPAAEEFEIMARLQRKAIKIYFNPSITGWHLQPVTITNKCQQEYKYGIGVAEVALKIPESLQYEQLRHLFEENSGKKQPNSNTKKIKIKIKQLFAFKPSRTLLLNLIKFFQLILPFKFLLFPLYRFSMGVFLFAGVREGERLFNNK